MSEGAKIIEFPSESTGPAEAGEGGIRPDPAELGGASTSYDIDGLLRLYEEVVRDTLVVPK